MARGSGRTARLTQGGAGGAGALRLAGECARIEERAGAQPGVVPQRERSAWKICRKRWCTADRHSPKSGDGASRQWHCSEKDFREAKRKFEVAYLTRQLGGASLECFADGGDDWLAPAKLAGKNCASWEFARPGQEAPEDDE